MRKPLKKKDNTLPEAMLLADISRLLGVEDWKQTFIRYADKWPGANDRLLKDLSMVCNEMLLDVAYNNL